MLNSKAIVAGVVVAMLCVAGWIYAGLGGKPHLMDQTCSKCHLAGKEVDAARAGRLIGSQEMLCGFCHKNVKRMSHPSGFAPKRKLPPGLPLDWKGEMTCSTCHEIHGSKPGMIRGGLQGKQLCMACHDAAFFSGMKDAGISLQQSGHAIPEMAEAEKGVGVDALSLQCMGCHNQQSDSLGIRVDRDGVVHHASGGANHPIGIPYPLVSRNREFRSKGSLPKVIWLPNGRLSCVSCHQPYKKEHGQLVLSNDKSSLCTQCHEL